MSEAGKPAPETPSTAAVPVPQPPALATLDDFKKLSLRVGVVLSAEDHPNADRLLVLKVDIGDGTPRQVVAGIKGTYLAADLLGKRVVVVANLKPAVLRGVESQGMVLAATEGNSIVVVTLDRPVSAGSQVK